jgi:EH domain-containing protein 1
MPSMFGKEAKKKELIKALPEIFTSLQREHQISPGDFPSIGRMQEVLEHQDFTKFHIMKPKLIENVDNMLQVDIARLMQMIPHEQEYKEEGADVKGGAFDTMNDSLFGSSSMPSLSTSASFQTLPRMEFGNLDLTISDLAAAPVIFPLIGFIF